MKKKIILGFVALTVFCGSLALSISLSQRPQSLMAEGEASSIVSSSEVVSSTSEDVTSGTAEEEHWYTEALSWIENKVVPLVGTISIASIMGTIVSVVTAISKHKGDKKNSIIINGQDAKIVALELSEKAHQEYEQKMLEQFSVTLTETAKTMAMVSNYAKTTAELVANQNGEIEKVKKMKESIDLSCDLIAKSMALSDVAVKSGIAQDAQKLVDNLKEVNKNGE